jgi:hypothetical protein
MSDLEDKLRSLNFRGPAPDIRRTVLAAVPARPAWREWLWPSPLAWGAVAGIWLIAFATTDSGSSRHAEATVAQFTATSRFQQIIEIERILLQQ